MLGKRGIFAPRGLENHSPTPNEANGLIARHAFAPPPDDQAKRQSQGGVAFANANDMTARLCSSAALVCFFSGAVRDNVGPISPLGLSMYQLDAALNPATTRYGKRWMIPIVSS